MMTFANVLRVNVKKEFLELKRYFANTLEQLYMSPVSAWRILLARVSGMVFNEMFIIVFLLFIAMLTTGEWLNLNPVAVIPILLLTVVSMIGVSFIVAGISVIVKQINAFLQILQFVIMAFAFIPLSVAPYLVFAPFVKGVDMTRHVMIHGYQPLLFADV